MYFFPILARISFSLVGASFIPPWNETTFSVLWYHVVSQNLYSLINSYVMSLRFLWSIIVAERKARINYHLGENESELSVTVLLESTIKRKIFWKEFRNAEPKTYSCQEKLAGKLLLRYSLYNTLYNIFTTKTTTTTSARCTLQFWVFTNYKYCECCDLIWLARNLELVI
jgi:hypothetical protein